MEILHVDEKAISFLADFIEPYEYSCILLASYIRKKSKNLYVISTVNSTEKITSADDIKGVFYFEKTLLHCLPEINQYDEDINRKIQNFFLDKNIKCIDGSAEGTGFLLNLLQNGDLQAFQINHYRLMTNEQIISPPENLSADDEVHRCIYDDLESIFDLQKAYICSEVAPRGKVVSDAEISLGLKQILKNQLCLAIFVDDKAVCKVNTNAIGINWVQLGGVYTHPRFRRNYYAWHLVAAICRRVAKSGKRTALFVKDINVPAITLYKKIGFVDAGLFEIAYF